MADRHEERGQDQADQLTSSALRPLDIGPVRIWPPTALAPMADLTDVCLRMLLKGQRTRHGEVALGLVVTEFLSSRALLKREPRVQKLLQFDDRERPLSVQIYGADPVEMGEAARLAEDAGADILDINMGCPVSKVTGHGSGAALLKDPPKARAMVAAVRRGTRLPVTVKMRAGWCAETADPVEFARGLEGEGAAALAIHPRTRADGYKGCPRREVIAAIKANVTIPVWGNGDILTAADAHALMAETGCDGVMIGRGALRNPRIFCEILGDTEGAAKDGDASTVARIDLALDYARDLASVLGPRAALHRSRKLLGLVFRDDPMARPLLTALGSFSDAVELCDHFRRVRDALASQIDAGVVRGHAAHVAPGDAGSLVRAAVV